MAIPTILVSDNHSYYDVTQHLKWHTPADREAWPIGDLQIIIRWEAQGGARQQYVRHFFVEHPDSVDNSTNFPSGWGTMKSMEVDVLSRLQLTIRNQPYFPFWKKNYGVHKTGCTISADTKKQVQTACLAHESLDGGHP